MAKAGQLEFGGAPEPTPQAIPTVAEKQVIEVNNITSADGTSISSARSFDPDSAEVLFNDMYISSLTVSSGLYFEFFPTFMPSPFVKSLEESLFPYYTPFGPIGLYMVVTKMFRPMRST
ncbi:MAG: hypothetical protein ACP5LF_05675 [Nitrososphaeria archaeon]